MASESILCLDIGSGTQDVFFHHTDREIENCPKFVLPSPARMVARRIFELGGKSIFLHGRNMGGGFWGALRKHMDMGGKVAAHTDAAYSLGDDLERLQASGVELVEECPDGYAPLYLADFDPEFWKRFLAAAELDYPDKIMACAQDHGFHPHESNRRGRFRLWERFLLEAGGRPEALIYQDVPKELTRLKDLQKSIGGGLVSDTGSAAVLGALYDDEIMAESHKRGLCLVNVGNSHTIAFLIHKGTIHGVYEQHTGIVDSEGLWNDLKLFRQGGLTFDQVFDNRGHGCLTLELPKEAAGFEKTYVLGPRRGMLSDYDVTFPAPGGDMMLGRLLRIA